MRKIKDPTLFQSIRKFLTEDMPIVRKKSANTVDAYRYTLNLFLAFLREKHNKLLCSVTAKDFCQRNVLDFMDWLLEVRGNKASTVNLRLKHIKRFCRFLMDENILMISELSAIQKIADIPSTTNDTIKFLTVQETKEILSSFTKQIESDNKQMKNLKNIKSAFFNQLGKGYTSISSILHNFKALPEGFEQDCNEVSSNLKIIGSISNSLNSIDSEISDAIGELQSLKESIFSENQIASWEIRDNRLKDLIKQFTITAHKEAAGRIGGFGIEKEGAKSGEITFF